MFNNRISKFGAGVFLIVLSLVTTAFANTTLYDGFNSGDWDTTYSNANGGTYSMANEEYDISSISHTNYDGTWKYVHQTLDVSNLGDFSFSMRVNALGSSTYKGIVSILAYNNSSVLGYVRLYDASQSNYGVLQTYTSGNATISHESAGSNETFDLRISRYDGTLFTEIDADLDGIYEYNQYASIGSDLTSIRIAVGKAQTAEPFSNVNISNLLVRDWVDPSTLPEEAFANGVVGMYDADWVESYNSEANGSDSSFIGGSYSVSEIDHTSVDGTWKYVHQTLTTDNLDDFSMSANVVFDRSNSKMAVARWYLYSGTTLTAVVGLLDNSNIGYGTFQVYTPDDGWVSAGNASTSEDFNVLIERLDGDLVASIDTDKDGTADGTAELLGDYSAITSIKFSIAKAQEDDTFSNVEVNNFQLVLPNVITELSSDDWVMSKEPEISGYTDSFSAGAYTLSALQTNQTSNAYHYFYRTLSVDNHADFEFSIDVDADRSDVCRNNGAVNRIYLYSGSTYMYIAGISDAYDSNNSSNTDYGKYRTYNGSSWTDHGSFSIASSTQYSLHIERNDGSIVIQIDYDDNGSIDFTETVSSSLPLTAIKLGTARTGKNRAYGCSSGSSDAFTSLEFDNLYYSGNEFE